jgi:hypothetical protein
MITLQFVPYSEIENISSVGRIRKLLNIAKENKIVLLEGRLKKEEEKELIKATMEEINDGFKGIELAVIEPRSKTDSNLSKLKKGFIEMLLGERMGLTIVGPANVVKEIKKDPTKIELMTRDIKPKRKGKN